MSPSISTGAARKIERALKEAKREDLIPLLGLRKSTAVRDLKQSKLGPTLREIAEREKRKRKAISAEVRAIVNDRAQGRCESCARQEAPCDPLQMDHFFGGRNKEPMEAVESCWMLHLSCHQNKTRNYPSRTGWLVAFAGHCVRYNYDYEAMVRKAQARR